MRIVPKAQYGRQLIVQSDNMSTHPLGKCLSDGDMRARLDQPWKM